jgi:hypothetical protein
MADANVVREASNVVTSENATTFYAERLGLADNNEPPEAVEESTEPAQIEEQSEPVAEEEANDVENEKPKDKLNKRFEKVSKRAEQAEAKAADLENRLREIESRVNPHTEQETAQDNGKPKVENFTDFDEYTEALVKWSADNAIKQKESQDAQRKMQDSWNAKLEKAREEYDDWDEVVPASKVIVRDEIRDSIIESDVGAQILYALASDEDYAKALAAMPVTKALKELGKLEAKFEAQAEEKPVAKIAQTQTSRSKAPSPISPLTGGKAGADILVDTNGEFLGTPSQWKAARLAGKIR